MAERGHYLSLSLPRRLVNDMLVKGHLYMEAIKRRDNALAECFQDETPEADTLWTAAAETAQKAHAEYDKAVAALHAARDKQ